MDTKRLDRRTELDMIIDLYFALELREQCTNCGGKGYQVAFADNDVDYEPCLCSNEADEVLRRHSENFQTIVNESLIMQGYDLAKLDKEITDLVAKCREEWNDNV